MPVYKCLTDLRFEAHDVIQGRPASAETTLVAVNYVLFFEKIYKPSVNKSFVRFAKTTGKNNGAVVRRESRVLASIRKRFNVSYFLGFGKIGFIPKTVKKAEQMSRGFWG